jgi:hypothetical protein
VCVRASLIRKPVNRVFCVSEQLVATGDDDGVIKVSPGAKRLISFGTHDKRTRSAPIPTTMTTSPTLPTLTTSGSSSPRRATGTSRRSISGPTRRRRRPPARIKRTSCCLSRRSRAGRKSLWARHWACCRCGTGKWDGEIVSRSLATTLIMLRCRPHPRTPRIGRRHRRAHTRYHRHRL